MPATKPSAKTVKPSKPPTLYEILGVKLGASDDDIKASHRKLAMKYHPDRNPNDKIAEEMFQEVQKAYDILSDPKKRAKYDKTGSIDDGPAAPTVTVLGKWIVVEPLAKGDIADLYKATQDGSPDIFTVKIACSGRDNDLMKAEAASLKTLFAKPDSYQKYLVPIQDSFEASGRRANVMPLVDYISLQEIQQHFPKGLDFRHIVWMGNRMLSALGYAHGLNIIHGAPVPSHMMFGPIDEHKVISHGLKLVDWCYSVSGESRKHIPALVNDYADHYPPEIKRKIAPVPGTDIFILMSSLKAASLSIPPRFKGLFDWCLTGSPGSRPNDAWKLQDKWTALAKEEYGPAKYTELRLS